MQVNVVDVSSLNTHSAKNGRQYQSIEVMYKNDQGQAQSKKLMSFANPAVFKSAQTWAKGDVIHVSTEKDSNGYWQWTSVGDAENVTDTRNDDAAPAQAQTSPTKTRVTGSNYETKDERAARQIMIVRQSSLSNAVATLAIEGSNASANDVISLAKLYEGYVLSEGDSSSNSIDDIASDIPF